MNKDKALESVNEIKELMEKSSKFISLSGLAAIMAGIYALVGAYIATQVITPGTHLIVALELMAIIASLVLVAAAVTACILSYYKSKKTGQKFFSRLTYRALWNFSLPMLTGGVLCISILMHEYYDILASVMLLFYGLALVNVSKFTYSSIVWLGYAFICLGVVDCFCTRIRPDSLSPAGREQTCCAGVQVDFLQLVRRSGLLPLLRHLPQRVAVRHPHRASGRYIRQNAVCRG